MNQAQGNNAAIGDLIGKQVEVRSQYGSSEGVDRGVLEVYDDPWIRLRKDNNEILCFPVQNVRMVKLWGH